MANDMAPWGEVVDDAERLTVDELLMLPDDTWMYELVQGRRIRFPRKGNAASIIGVHLTVAVFGFVDECECGVVTSANGMFNLTQAGEEAETGLLPTVAYVRADRTLPRESPEYSKAWRLAPDLVAEVVSPSQFRPEMAAKARLYLKAGVRLLWMVWPRYQQVDVWRQGADAPVAMLGLADSLDGEDVLPGFTYPLARLFR